MALHHRRPRASHAARPINSAVSRRLVLAFAGAALFASAAAQSAGASVLWRADGEKALSDEWAELSTGLHCAMTSDQVGGDSRAYRTTAMKDKGAGAYAFVINDGDNCYGERAEIGEANPTRGAMSDTRLFREGQDDWVSFQVRLGADFPKDTSAWQVIAQWKQLPYSNMPEPYPMLALQVHNGRYWLDHRGSDTWSGPPAVLNRWATFTFHIHWSDDPSKGAVSIRATPTVPATAC